MIYVYAGTFHLLHMLIDDYISHCLETLIEDEAHKAHFTNINLPTPGTVYTIIACVPTATAKIYLYCIKCDRSSLVPRPLTVFLYIEKLGVAWG